MVSVVEDMASADNIHAEGTALARTSDALNQHVESSVNVMIA